MSKKYRILFLSIFSIFFIVTTPFLILYSLGYDLSLEDRELRNSLTISIDSRPRLADVYTNDQLLLRSSGELRANENQLISLSIREDGYLNEDFVVWSGEDQNTTARLNDVWLLPEDSVVIQESDNISFINLLSRDLAIIEESNRYYVQLYSFGGLQGTRQAVTSGDLGTIITFDSTSRWQPINDSVFWNKQNEQILLNSGEVWKLYDTRFFSIIPQSLSYISPNELLILDTSGNIWLWNHTDNRLRFIESNFEGMSYTDIPNYIWLWKYDTLFRVSPNQFTENILFEQFEFSSNSLINDISIESDFVVKNVYQGIYVHIANFLIYIPDYNKEEWIVLSSDAYASNSANESVIWIDTSDTIWVANLELSKIEAVTTIPNISSVDRDLITLYYYFLWKRIMIYTPDKVTAIWYDKNIINTSIVNYNHKDWIKNKLCYTELIDRYQFCLQNGMLIAYRNTSIW